MLRINIDQYIFPSLIKSSENSIYTFSKRISINPINFNNSNNTQQKNNLFNETFKINGQNNKSIKNSYINDSNKLLRKKSKFIEIAMS